MAHPDNKEQIAEENKSIDEFQDLGHKSLCPETCEKMWDVIEELKKTRNLLNE